MFYYQKMKEYQKLNEPTQRFFDYLLSNLLIQDNYSWTTSRAFLINDYQVRGSKLCEKTFTRYLNALVEAKLICRRIDTFYDEKKDKYTKQLTLYLSKKPSLFSNLYSKDQNIKIPAYRKLFTKVNEHGPS